MVKTMDNSRADKWSGNWVRTKLIKYSENYEEFDENSAGSCKDLVIALISSNFLSVTDKYAIKYRIATMSLQKIAAEDLEQLLGDENVDFVLNVPKEPYITQSALEFANEKKFAIGGLGDLMRALRDQNVSTYIHKEVVFVLRGLGQHNRVCNVIRIDNRRYKIYRGSLPSVVVLALNDYDLTADVVRSAIEKFPKFDAIVMTNPNCKCSKKSIDIINSLDKKLLSWGELLSELHKAWN